MHADGVLKLPKSFEHIDPEAVGNERRILMSEITGRGAVLEKIRKIDPTVEKSSPETAKILAELKMLESKGYQFEGADSSFELLIRRNLGKYKKFFELINYRVTGSGPNSEEPAEDATAIVKVQVSNQTQLMAAEGNGPVNALDKALRHALEVFFPMLKAVHLTDYKVRVMDGKSATASTVRVLITSTDGKNVWTTVGVSSDVIEASCVALTESIEYKLITDFLL